MEKHSLATAILRNFPLLVFVALLPTISGCNNVRESQPIARVTDTNPLIVVSSSLPEEKYLPGNSAKIAESNYVLIQTEGGNALLGPLIGAALIQAKSNAIAKASTGAYVALSPSTVAEQVLPASILTSNAADASYVLKPFVFVQKCYDEQFRLSLVFHLEGRGARAEWIGRYLYHISGPIPVASFASPTTDKVKEFREKLRLGSEVLANLLSKDINGNLPATGQKVELGSMHLLGEKLGGLGIYTMPEEMYLEDVDIIEETADHVIARIKGNMKAPGSFGGMIFGTHYILKSLIHKLEKT